MPRGHFVIILSVMGHNWLIKYHLSKKVSQALELRGNSTDFT